MSDLPKGDAALIAAINSGAPVPTNERQAGELQRWGVWYSTPTESAWCEPTFDNESDAIRFEQRSNAKAQRYDPTCRYEVRPYPAPTPTPPPAPGELPLTDNGIEWTWAYSSLYSKYVITNGKRFIDVCFEPQAKALCARLNRADAMERVLSRIAAAEAPFSYPQAQSFIDDASAALRK